MSTGRTNEALWERMKIKATKQIGGGWSARAAQTGIKYVPQPKAIADKVKPYRK